MCLFHTRRTGALWTSDTNTHRRFWPWAPSRELIWNDVCVVYQDLDKCCKLESRCNLTNRRADLSNNQGIVWCKCCVFFQTTQMITVALTRQEMLLHTDFRASIGIELMITYCHRQTWKHNVVSYGYVRTATKWLGSIMSCAIDASFV